MERFANNLSLAVAACFVGSAAFLYGQALGLEQRDIIWLFTFSDIVNHAPATLLAYGAIFAIFLQLDFGVQSINAKIGTVPHSWLSYLFLPAILLLFCLGAYFLFPKIIAIVGVTFALSTIPLGFKTRLINQFGEFFYKLVDGAFWAISTLIMLGFILANVSLEGHQGIKVVMGDKVRCGKASLTLDRGVVLVRGGQYELVPWGLITRIVPVRQTPKAPRPDQKADTCFGMV